MDTSLIIKQIQEKGWGPYHISGFWINFACPFSKENHTHGTDTHFSFGICTKGQGRYFCFTCQVKGPLRKLFGDFPLPLCLLDGPQIHKKEKDIIYPESFLYEYKKTYGHPYLDKREVPYKIREKLDFRYDWKGHRICAPIRNVEQQLIGFVGRSLVSQPKYYMVPYMGLSNPYIWLGEHWVDFCKTIILVEGLFDCARVLQIAPNCLASLGVALSVKKLKRIQRSSHILTLYDNDSSGDLARKKCSIFFGKNVQHLYVPKPYKDPGETPVEVLQELLQKNCLIWS